MNRVYYDNRELEEYQQGMWRIVRGEDRKKNAESAASLMRDIAKFLNAMHKAVANWPKSCAHNLTAEDTNRLAWLGHAGCLLGVGSPEENTRAGWHMLTPAEQDAANKAAQTVLDYWLDVYSEWVQLEMFGAAA
jgi:hypothetical protein